MTILSSDQMCQIYKCDKAEWPNWQDMTHIICMVYQSQTARCFNKENLSLLRPAWNTNMSQFTNRFSSKWLALCKDRQKQRKKELNLLIQIHWEQRKIVKYFENLQLGHAKCHKLKKLNY